MVVKDIFQEPIGKYPLFQPNQVLTNEHLNSIVNFLDEQNRLTRICLIGMGIVCGLEGQWDEDEACLVITEGCGITSEGYLIQSGECQLKFYQEVNILLKLFGLQNNEDLSRQYQNGFPFYELFEVKDPNKDPETYFDINQDFVEEKVLLILLECHEITNDKCLNDCDEKGSQLNYKLRKFLVEEELARRIINVSYNPTLEEGDLLFPGKTVEDLFYDQFAIPNLYLERFGYFKDAAGTSSSLSNIINFDIFSQRYFNITDNVTARIHKVFGSLIKVFSPIFSSFQITKAKQDELLALIPIWQDETGVHPYEIQYRYDHLCDLILAYNEFIEVTADLIADCPPQSFRFPKHLWLGQLGVEAEYPLSIYRTPITQPPIFNGNHHRLNAAKVLFYRLFLLAQGFKIPEATLVGTSEIRITPSRITGAPLSKRAIPYYYLNHEDLRKFWDPRKKRKGRWRELYSYYRPLDNANPNLPYDDPLVYDFDGHDFLRIEGHIGKDYKGVFTKLVDEKRRYNLAFDIVALKLGETYDGDLDFECPEFDAQYHKLRIDLLCDLEEKIPLLFPGGVPAEVEAAAQELSDSLTQELNDFVYSFETGAFITGAIEFIQAFQTLRDLIVSNPDIGEQCPFSMAQTVPFQFVYDSYQELLEKTRSKLLFHGFADLHPGMEHKGGVPVGGTFILVHADPSELGSIINSNQGFGEIIRGFVQELAEEGRLDPVIDVEGLRNQSIESLINILGPVAEELRDTQNIIVGDFYLPYLCCGDKAGLSFVVPRQPPVVTVTPTEFCAEIRRSGIDPQRYLLDIVSFPPGAIPSGPGIEEDNGLYYFIPADLNPAEIPPLEGGAVMINFRVGADSTVIPFTILPLPQTDFNMLVREPDMVEGELNTGELVEVCENHIVSLVPVNETGLFTITRNGTEIDVFATGLRLDLLELNLDPEEQTDLIIRHDIDESGGCSWYTLKTLRVSGLPNPSFQIFKDTNPITEICVEEGNVRVVPVREGGKFIYTVNNATNELGPDLELSFDNINVPDGGQVVITFVHEVLGIGGCPNTATETLTVYGRPLAGFGIFDGTNPVTDKVCMNEEDIFIRPDQEGGTFTVFEDTMDRTAILDVVTLHLNLSELEIPFEEETVLTIIHNIEDEHGCTNNLEVTLVVSGLPNTAFQIFRIEEEVDTICENEGPITLVPEIQDGNFYVSRDGGASFQVLTGNTFDPSIPDLPPNAPPAEVIFRYERTLSDGGCTGTTDKPLTIFPQPDAAFTVGPNDVSTICTGDGPIALIPVDTNTSAENFQVLLVVGTDPANWVEIPNIVGTNLELNLPAIIAFADAQNPAALIERATVAIRHEIVRSSGCSDNSQKMLDVASSPQAAFDASIRGQFDGNQVFGLEVLIENIRPQNAETYEWIFEPQPDNLSEAEPGQPFIARFNYLDLEPNSDIKINLIVSRFGCPDEVSRSVRVPAPIFIERLELQYGNVIPDDFNEVEGGIVDENMANNGEYGLTSFHNLGMNFRAIPNMQPGADNPSILVSISFKLDRITATDPTLVTVPVANHSSLSSGNYRLEEVNPFGVPIDFGELPQGDYIITVIPSVAPNFSQPMVPGFRLRRQFTIIDDMGRGVEPRELPEEENGISLLNSRAAKHRKDLNDLSTDSNLAKMKAFGLANLFVSVMGTEEQLSGKFEEALSAILTSLKRAKGDRKAQLKKLVGIIVHNYLDKLVAGNKESISDQVKDLLVKSVEKMKKADVSPATLKRQWKSKELKDKLDAKVVSQYMKLLK